MLSNETTRRDPNSNHNAPRPTNHADALALLGSRDSRKIGHNTTLERLEGGTIGVRFHDTIIVRFYASGSLDLNSGGYRTNTTKERINRYLPEGYSLYQRAKVWRIQGPDKIEQDFNDGVMVMAAPLAFREQA